MRRPQYTVEIDRLVLTDLDLTPVQAEQVRSQLAGDLQAALAGRPWAGAPAASDLERVDLPAVSLAEALDAGRLASALAERIARAMPGTSQAQTRRSEDG